MQLSILPIKHHNAHKKKHSKNKPHSHYYNVKKTMTHYLKVKCKNNEHVPCLLLVSPTDSPAQSQKLTGLNAETQTVLYCLFIKHYFKQQSVDQSAVKFYKPHTKTIPTIKDRNNNLQIT